MTKHKLCGIDLFDPLSLWHTNTHANTHKPGAHTQEDEQRNKQTIWYNMPLFVSYQQKHALTRGTRHTHATQWTYTSMCIFTGTILLTSVLTAATSSHTNAQIFTRIPERTSVFERDIPTRTNYTKSACVPACVWRSHMCVCKVYTHLTARLWYITIIYIHI